VYELLNLQAVNTPPDSKLWEKVLCCDETEDIIFMKIQIRVFHSTTASPPHALFPNFSKFNSIIMHCIALFFSSYNQLFHQKHFYMGDEVASW